MAQSLIHYDDFSSIHGNFLAQFSHACRGQASLIATLVKEPSAKTRAERKTSISGKTTRGNSPISGEKRARLDPRSSALDISSLVDSLPRNNVRHSTHEGQAFAFEVKTESRAIPSKNANADEGDVKYKTELCRNFELTGRCRYGNRCSYAHGKEQLIHKKHINLHYKSKKCNKFFERGFCEYGARCQYLHKEDSHAHILDSYCEKLLVWIERNPHLDMSSIMKKTHAFGTRNSFFLKLEKDNPDSMDQSIESL